MSTVTSNIKDCWLCNIYAEILVSLARKIVKKRYNMLWLSDFDICCIIISKSCISLSVYNKSLYSEILIYISHSVKVFYSIIKSRAIFYLSVLIIEQSLLFLK